MTIYQKLADIQANMKCPKNLYNSFGKYNYRNAESILEAFKPYGAKANLLLLLTDDIKQVGDRIYVMAEAKMIDLESETSVSTYGFAREAEEQKGMDAAQITGCASSYARKYALNAMFLIDDTKDPDTDEHRTEAENRSKQTQKRTQPQQPQASVKGRRLNKQELEQFTKDINIAGASIQDICNRYRVRSLADMTPDQANEAFRIMTAS